jgi:hypothetical protein
MQPQQHTAGELHLRTARLQREGGVGLRGGELHGVAAGGDRDGGHDDGLGAREARRAPRAPQQRVHAGVRRRRHQPVEHNTTLDGSAA